jgi:hypothetical protein
MRVADAINAPSCCSIDITSIPICGGMVFVSQPIKWIDDRCCILFSKST